MTQEYLSPSPPPPAINEAMVKASERLQKGLPVYNFTSGNVGALPLNLTLFDKIDIGVNDNVPEGISIIANGLRRGIIESLHPKPSGLTYSTTGGTTSVKAAALRYFREIHDIPLTDEDIDRVIVTAGGQQAMTASLRSLKSQTEVLMLQWDYAPVSPILKDHGLKEIRVNVNEDLSLDVSDFENKLSEKQVFYLSMPNNPTGYTSVDDLQTIIEAMENRGGGVVWDAPYVFMLLKLVNNKAVFNREFLKKTLERFKIIGRKHFECMNVLSSLSKTCLIAGLRVGLATASRHWITNMSAIIGRENLSSPTLSFTVGEYLLNSFIDNPICHEWTCKVLADRLTVLIEEIGDHLILPQNNTFGALYVLVKTPEDGDKFAGKLVEEKGIVGVPGSSFFSGPTNAFRLSLVATPWTEGDKTWKESVSALRHALNSS
jgi:aspartate/methionine/tyrosine aminotransferase